MNKTEAINLLREFAAAEIESVKEINSRGTITKKTNRREHKAAAALFSALTGQKPTQTQLLEILNY